MAHVAKTGSAVAQELVEAVLGGTEGVGVSRHHVDEETLEVGAFAQNGHVAGVCKAGRGKGQWLATVGQGFDGALYPLKLSRKPRRTEPNQNGYV